MCKSTRIVRDAAEAPRIVQSLGATPQNVIIAFPTDRVKLGRSAVPSSWPMACCANVLSCP